MAAGWWGYVTDEYTGEPIAGATVKWSWCGVYGFIGETTTNDQGYYSLTDAVDRNHAGHCETLNCEKQGYLSGGYQQLGWDGEYTRHDFQLHPAG